MEEGRSRSTWVSLLPNGLKRVLSARPLLKTISGKSTTSNPPKFSRLEGAEPMVEKTNRHNMRNHDKIIIEKEAVIQPYKGKLFDTLSSKLDEKDYEDFNLFFQKVGSSVRSWYRRVFEETMHIYEFFDPATSEEKLSESQMTKSEIDDLEIKFLSLFFYLTEKSNYKLVSDKEFEVATSANYLLNLPIKVDFKKLDSTLFERFFSLSLVSSLPLFAKQHLIFRRGIGMDQTDGYFIFHKIDLLISRMWSWFINALCHQANSEILDTIQDLRSRNTSEDGDYVQNAPNPTDDSDALIINRIRLENMNLNMNTLFSKNVIQEPTFERMILVYRPSGINDQNKKKGQGNKQDKDMDGTRIEITASDPSTENLCKNRSIVIKQFRHIPFADMEIVWPEKMTPGLTAYGWASFMSTAVGGLMAVICSVSFNLSLTVVYTIIVAAISYIVKMYFAWSQSMSNYKALMQASMYDKHLDSGRGTLLHLCDDAWQQEVKEVMLSYFVLLTSGPLHAKELGRRCEAILANEFQKNVKFDFKDAALKLERLGIVHVGEDGRLHSESLKAANAIIGFTVEELYDIFPSDFNIWAQGDDALTGEGSEDMEEDLEEEAKRLFSQTLFNTRDA